MAIQSNVDMGAISAPTTTNQAVQNDRDWANYQADKQMRFQERMSNTSYQRAIADMKKAGLNPMLAYMKGGADSPVGSQGSTASTVQQNKVVQKQTDTQKYTAWVGFGAKVLSSLITTVGSIFGSKAPTKKSIPGFK